MRRAPKRPPCGAGADFTARRSAAISRGRVLRERLLPIPGSGFRATSADRVRVRAPAVRALTPFLRRVSRWFPCRFDPHDLRLLSGSWTPDPEGRRESAAGLRVAQIKRGQRLGQKQFRPVRPVRRGTWALAQRFRSARCPHRSGALRYCSSAFASCRSCSGKFTWSGAFAAATGPGESRSTPHHPDCRLHPYRIGNENRCVSDHRAL